VTVSYEWSCVLVEDTLSDLTPDSTSHVRNLSFDTRGFISIAKINQFPIGLYASRCTSIARQAVLRSAASNARIITQ
jgi:hypothetical protein